MAIVECWCDYILKLSCTAFRAPLPFIVYLISQSTSMKSYNLIVCIVTSYYELEIEINLTVIFIQSN